MSHDVIPYMNISKYIKFEDKYVIHNSIYSYLNDLNYEYYEEYLNKNNKIAIIFCKSNDEEFIIRKSPLILIHKMDNKKEREKIIHEYMEDFYAFESESIELPNWKELT